MERRAFIKTTCMACLTGFAMSELFESCTILKYTSVEMVENDLVVPLLHFFQNQVNDGVFKKYIIVENDKLKYPICVYRTNENNYTALWMQCTHQNAELQVFGNVLQCPAHGSEFSNKGKALNTPASRDLKTFPVTISDNQIKISLK